MTPKIDAKFFLKKLAFGFKYNKSNLVNFHSTTQKSEKI